MHQCMYRQLSMVYSDAEENLKHDDYIASSEPIGSIFFLWFISRFLTIIRDRVCENNDIHEKCESHCVWEYVMSVCSGLTSRGPFFGICGKGFNVASAVSVVKWPNQQPNYNNFLMLTERWHAAVPFTSLPHSLYYFCLCSTPGAWYRS